MDEAHCDEIDQFIGSYKELAGLMPQWTDFFHRDWQLRWGIQDVHGAQRGELCITCDSDQSRWSISCLYQARLIYRLDVVPLRECKAYPYSALKLGLPPRICGPHTHPWDANRDYVLVNGFCAAAPQAEDRRPGNLADCRVGMGGGGPEHTGGCPTTIVRSAAAEQTAAPWAEPMIECNELHQLLARDRVCEVSDLGLRLATDCLYPSADVVFVHITKTGNGFRVTDGGGCARNVLLHAKDEHALRSGLEEARKRHQVAVEGGALVAIVPDADWLQAAIAAVANGAALAANVAIDHTVKRTERDLAKRIEEALSRVVAPHRIARDVEWPGNSGKTWKIDFAVVDAAKPLLVRPVNPHPISISSAYTAFGDIGRASVSTFCVYARPIPQEDQTLVRQVADLVPAGAVEASARQALGLLH